MALYKRKEFAALCGISEKQLAVYIGRGKVIRTGKLIDDTILENKEFLKSKIGKLSETQNQQINPGVEYEREIISNNNELKVISLKKQANETNSNNKDASFFELEKQKKAHDIEKIQEEIELLRLKKKKLHGIVIPTEMVKNIFSQHTKSILVEFSNSADKILTKIAKKKNMSNSEVSEVRKEIIHEINLAVDKSIEESKKNIKQIINEYTETRTPGERT